MKRYIWLVITILWMGVIFWFSSQDGSNSSETSGRIVTLVQKIAYPEWDSLSPEQYEIQFGQLTYFVRKMGHFTEYAILGGCLAMFLSTFPILWKFRFLVGAVISCVYATTDEFHQSFVADRSAKPFDVCIDTAGAVVGCLIILGICAMYRERRGKHDFRKNGSISKK